MHLTKVLAGSLATAGPVLSAANPVDATFKTMTRTRDDTITLDLSRRDETITLDPQPIPTRTRATATTTATVTIWVTRDTDDDVVDDDEAQVLPRQLIWPSIPPAADAVGVQMVPVDVTNIMALPNAGSGLCPGNEKHKALCCEGALFGWLHTGCVAPFPVPRSADEFVDRCHGEAKAAECCSVNMVCYMCQVLTLSLFVL